MSSSRLHALVNFANSPNVSWEFYDVSIWSTVELGVGVMCTCMPSIRLLLVKLFPVLGGSSNRSTHPTYKPEGDGSFWKIDRNGRAAQAQRLGSDGTSSRDVKISSDLNGTIPVQPSYMVRHPRRDFNEVGLLEKNIGSSTKSIELEHKFGDGKR